METSHLRHTLCIVVHDRIPAFSLPIYTLQALPLSIHMLPRDTGPMYVRICVPAAAEHSIARKVRAYSAPARLVTCNP
ncbi:hypothetical protein WN48_03363 [Eufriesea mexicana]|uniref:Uncharacterized protein n=1 Tax=Eufriesea mexicana TaxID=516756 RepID=A0A310SMS9_9HYME|nr:hypothetical protein WN48_03363 [Eufriesea mexicana]